MVIAGCGGVVVSGGRDSEAHLVTAEVGGVAGDVSRLRGDHRNALI